ncbi:cytochrome P450 [Kutzneria viridogrisea]|uniref:Cytochrome P450 n=2 Tax=Kutzneria TaxID=43356 RepID=W5WAK5_9PSEU|nr:cytochrome P450 [Kutzneria albida]AHH98138.1 hypothetical protein KALB_4776 [Kutzneria albida DSM 43870]MBA8924179.1 cytochrome P450 [Kutzneria viridogrisea]
MPECARPDLSRFDPFSADFQQCPSPWYRALRSAAPVHLVPEYGLWFVTSRALVQHALERPEVFSSRFGQPQSASSPAVAGQVAAIRAEGWPTVPTILTEDPPAHHRFRQLVARAFTPRLVARQEPGIRRLCAELFDTVATGEEVEFVSRFAVPFPIAVIADVLGVDRDRLPDLTRWSRALAESIGARVDDESELANARSTLEFQRFFANQLDQRRTDPREDVLTGLVNAHRDTAQVTDEALSTAESLSIITQLLVAGNETTAKLLTSLLHELGRSPRLWAWLREDPLTRADPLVEEALRLHSPVQGMFRVLTRSTELGGVELPAGARVVLCFASANRDAPDSTHPDVLDPERGDGAGHLAFGHGIHYCLGAPLARLQTRVALRELAARVDSISLTGRDDRYTPSFLLHGLSTLHCRLTPSD